MIASLATSDLLTSKAVGTQGFGSETLRYIRPLRAGRVLVHSAGVAGRDALGSHRHLQMH